MTTKLDETRDGFRFRGGRLALDLPATLAGRISGQHREALAAPADLDRWLIAAGLADTAPGATAEDLLVAKTLREAVFDLAMARVEGGPASEAARLTLNTLAAAPDASPRLDPDGVARRRGSARALLGGVAREAVLLLGSSEAARIRQCEGGACAILFLDTSRKGDRRWCSMSACGNRAKVAAFRGREREADA